MPQEAAAAPRSARDRPLTASSAVRRDVLDATAAELVSRVTKLDGASARLRLLQRHRTLWGPQLVDRLADETTRLARVDLAQAARLARLTLTIARRIDDEGARGRSLRAAGHVFYLQGRYRRALTCYEAAVTRFERAKRPLDAAVTRSSGLHTLSYLGDYARALAWGRQAAAVFRDRRDHLRLARLEENLASVFFRQDRFKEALARDRRAYAILQRHGTPDDVAAVLRNMAVVYISLGDFRPALATYRRARALCERHGLTRLVAEVDYNIAYLYFLRGEYIQAINAYEAVGERCRLTGDPYHDALCDLDQAELSLEINLHDRGAALAERARTKFETLGMTYERAKALTFLALASSHLGDLDRALALLSEARRLFRRERNRVWPPLVDLYRAVVFHRAGRAVPARRLAERALYAFAQSPLATRAAMCELFLARLQLEAGELPHAQSRAASALSRLEGTDAPALQCQAHLVLGLVHEAAGDRDGAYVAYRRSRLYLERMRSRLRGDDLKIAFLMDKLAVYERLTALCLARGTPAATRAAFAYVEEAKSRALADLIAFRPPPPVRTRDARTRKRLRAVRESQARLTWYSRQLEPSRDGAAEPIPPDSRTRDGLRREQRRFGTLLDRLGRDDLEFASLVGASPAGVDRVRSTLPSNAVLVEYYAVRGRFYAAVVARHRLDFVPLAPVDEVRRSLGLLQLQLSKFQLRSDYLTTFERALEAATLAHLQELHTALLAPLRRFLCGVAHLVVVPHDVLHCLPFHALYDGRRFVVDALAVSYAPSATVRHLCATRPITTATGALVLGVPDDHAPLILGEARAVAATLGGAHLRIGRRASRRLLEREGHRYRLVHLATHGRFRQDNPAFSSIRLGDGDLHLFDLYELRLPADLVTLSGCATGLNAVVGADELLGLTRGLLYAGARAVLVSLWDVHDRSTAGLMVDFYRRLTPGRDMAAALREAMLALKSQAPHPYFWAPFMLIGDASRPLQPNRAISSAPPEHPVLTEGNGTVRAPRRRGRLSALP